MGIFSIHVVVSSSSCDVHQFCKTCNFDTSCTWCPSQSGCIQLSLNNTCIGGNMKSCQCSFAVDCKSCLGIDSECVWCFDKSKCQRTLEFADCASYSSFQCDAGQASATLGAVVAIIITILSCLGCCCLIALIGFCCTRKRRKVTYVHYHHPIQASPPPYAPIYVGSNQPQTHHQSPPQHPYTNAYQTFPQLQPQYKQ